MSQRSLKDLLEEVAAGRTSVADALAHMGDATFVDLGGTLLDVHRESRAGVPEVIFSENKDGEQLEAIARRFAQRGEAVLFSRLDPAGAEAVGAILRGSRYDRRARSLLYSGTEVRLVREGALVVSAGASDAPVVGEVAMTLEHVGWRPDRLEDCGVAGLHRLLAHLPTLRRARCVIVVAGMDGALPSVVSGLVRAPMIAVPTSVGYGPGGGGLTPLLAMLASCAPGLTVVNVDNGVGAALAAHRILSALVAAEAGAGGGERPQTPARP